MGILWVQGVVKNGQVVLDAPLDVPDGTVLTVTEYDPDDNPNSQEPTVNLSDEDATELLEFVCGKKDKALWPAFEARIQERYGPWLPHHRSRAA